MREPLLGVAFCALLAVLQCAPRAAPWGGAFAVDAVTLGGLWFALSARPVAGLSVGWLAGWGMDLVSGAPAGVHAIPMMFATFLAVRLGPWARRAPLFLQAACLALCAVLASVLQGLWFWAATDAPLSWCAWRCLALGLGSILAALPFAWAAAWGLSRFLEPEEVFAR